MRMYRVLVKDLKLGTSEVWDFVAEHLRDQFVTDLIHDQGADTYDFYYSEKK